MITKTKRSVHKRLVEITQKYFELTIESEYDEIYEEFLSDESTNLMSSTAWPLICYKNNRLDFLMKSATHSGLEMSIHDVLSLAFQMDTENCRTGLFQGLSEAFLQWGWHKFDTKNSLSFTNGKSAILIADTQSIPLIMPFVQVDSNYRVDFSFLWLFSMEMRASLLLEISAYAEQHNNAELAFEILSLAAGLTETYDQIGDLMIKNTVIGSIITEGRKRELLTETTQAYQAKRLLASSKSPKQIKVLFVASNPGDQMQLRLDEEIREINEKIRLSEHRNSIELISRWAVRPIDLLQSLNEVQPHIVHFSGHGTSTGEIILVDDQNESKPVSQSAIVEMMKVMSDNIQVVVFNSCFSETQAEAVTKHIDVAIGMNDSLNDATAKSFAAQFYSAIGFGRSIQAAFEQAKLAIMFDGIREENIPQIYSRHGVDANKYFLVNP